MVFFKIKLSACILTYPISNYNFLGESFENTLFYTIFFLLIPQYGDQRSQGNMKEKSSTCLSFGKKSAIQIKHLNFPPGTWVETINATLEPLVQ